MRSEITSEAALREIVGTPHPRVAAKVLPSLATEHREWLAASPFCLVSTSDADGRVDVSPKGDPEGLAIALDDTTIAIPERPGNRRVDGFLNILQNPHVGLLFLIPGRGDTLRVNGRATLLADAPYAERMVVKGHRPTVILEIAVEEVFFHCSKAFLRSHLWDPTTWEPGAVPSRAQIAQRLERPHDSIEVLEEYYGPAYARHLY